MTGMDCHKESARIRATSRSGPVDCEACTIGKTARLPFTASSSRATHPLQLVHTDLCGPFQEDSHTGGLYLMTITDDYSRLVWVGLLNDKTSARTMRAMQDYKAWAEKRHHAAGHRLMTIRSDGGGEYWSGISRQFLTEHGIEGQSTAPYSPNSNGVAERGLGNAPLRRGLGEAALASYGQEGQEIVQVAALHLSRLLISPCGL